MGDDVSAHSNLVWMSSIPGHPAGPPHRQACSCPNCVGVDRADYYITSPYYNGEAWHRDIPKRKPRRVGLIRAAWQHVHGCEDWVYPIHTLDHHQRMVRILADRNLSAYVATDTTQGRLTSIE